MKNLCIQRMMMLIVILFVAHTAFGQKDSLVRLVNPPSIAVPKGYSQAAVIDLGNCKMVIFSGQVPMDRNGNLVGKDNFEQQARKVFENIRDGLKDFGGTMNQVIKLNYYIRDVANLQLLRFVRDQYVNTARPPASTLVEVSKLYRDDVMLEIEATAVIQK